MRAVVVGFLVSSYFAIGQAANSTGFDVASIKLCQRAVGKDANNNLKFGPAGISARNVTLKRLIEEAYQLQPHQVVGRGWLDLNEYDLEAKAATPVPRDQLALMLRAVLTERFRLTFHRETRDARVYELVTDKVVKIQSLKEEGAARRPGAWPLFRGTMQQFANILAVQLTKPAMDNPGRPGMASGPPPPVLDKTGLAGVYEIDMDLKPETNVEMFTLWQRVLRDRYGLKLENRKAAVEMLVVDNAEKCPSAN